MITWLRHLKFPLLAAALVGGIYVVRLQPIAVEVQQIEKDSIVAEVMGTGTLEARVRATISPEIAGRIAEVLVDQGDSIASGQLLARLDDGELAQQVRLAEANVEAARVSIGRYEAEQRQAVAKAKQADADFKRTSELVDRDAATESELEKAQEAFEVARAGVAKANAALLEAKQQVTVSEESLLYQKTRLAYTQLRAPFDGLVIDRHRDAGAIAVPGSPILDIISLDELWISAWVDETEMDHLEAELPARVVFRSQPKSDYAGQVVRLGKQSDRETREFVVDVRVVDLPTNWSIGQRAEVYIEWARKEETIVLPEKLLARRNGQTGVYATDGVVARWQPIEIGLRGGDYVEVTKGLQTGETVITPLQSGKDLEGRKITVP